MSAQANPFPAVPSNDYRTVHLHLLVTDPDIVSEIERRADGAERDDFAIRALKIGVIALRQAAGTIDVEAMRRVGDDIIGSVRDAFRGHADRMNHDLTKVVADYFDPKSGSLPARIEQLVKGDGDLDRLITRHIDGDRSTIHKTLDALVGPKSQLHKMLSPEQAGSVVASMKIAVDDLVKRQREEVLRQFSLDEKGSALSRLVAEVATENGKLRTELARDVDKVAKEFSLDNDKGALSKLIGRVEKAQRTIVEQLSLDHDGSALHRMSTMLEKTGKTIEKSLTLDVETSPLARLRRELVGISKGIEESQAKFQIEMRAGLAALEARKAEIDRSPRRGTTFEDAMGDFLADDARRAGDLYERVGKRPGPTGSKKGDHLVVLGPETAAPNARIVVESKAQKGYTETGALAELSAARENREAQIGVFVFDKVCAPDGLDGLRRVGDDLLAVWDREDPATDLYLRAAMSVARALAFRERTVETNSEANLRAIDRAVSDIEKRVKRIDEIIKAGRIVEQKGSSIQDIASTLKEELTEQLEVLRTNLETLGGDGGGE